MPFETYLKNNGFKERAIECECPHCITVGEFMARHPIGRFILICQDRAVPVSDGVCFDAKDSLEEVVIYYFEGGH